MIVLMIHYQDMRNHSKMTEKKLNIFNLRMSENDDLSLDECDKFLEMMRNEKKEIDEEIKQALSQFTEFAEIGDSILHWVLGNHFVLTVTNFQQA